MTQKKVGAKPPSEPKMLSADGFWRTKRAWPWFLAC